MTLLAQIDFTNTDFLKDVGIPIVTFILGFFISRYTLSKKERKDLELEQQKNADTYHTSISDAFNSFTTSMAQYLKNEGPSSFQDFYSIATAGEAYFTRLKMVCDASFCGTLSPHSIQTTFKPMIKEAWERSIPQFYDVLGKIAEERNLHWNGEFRRENYESIVSFYEKHCLD